ncbi:MAG TPA: hypothetical protein VFW33_21315, partial [Gemmataceae bacterium]|nr:hypothetical protein [Gemmataceae bacterium]
MVQAEEVLGDVPLDGGQFGPGQRPHAEVGRLRALAEVQPQFVRRPGRDEAVGRNAPARHQVGAVVLGPAEVGRDAAAHPGRADGGGGVAQLVHAAVELDRRPARVVKRRPEAVVPGVLVGPDADGRVAVGGPQPSEEVGVGFELILDLVLLLDGQLEVGQDATVFLVIDH